MIGILVAVALQTALSTDPRYQPTPAFNAYADCIVHGAIDLIPSGEDTETLVKAAQLGCEYLIPAVLAEHKVSMQADPVLKKYNTDFGFDFDKDAAESVSGYRNAGHDLGIRYVVIEKSKRAKKKV